MTIETKVITLIRTKLQRPRLPGGLIPRRWLLDRLHAGSACKLTLISAQAGAGKTMLLALEKMKKTILIRSRTLTRVIVTAPTSSQNSRRREHR